MSRRAAMAGRGLPPLASLLMFASAVAVASEASLAEAAQDVNIAIQYDYYGEPVSAVCMASGSSQRVSVTGLPTSAYVALSQDNKGSYQTATLHIIYDIYGLTCSVGSNQAVIAPVKHPQDLRTVTVSRGEDLRLQLSRYWHGTTVKWRKESLQNLTRKTATLTNLKELVIPFDELEGSGLYTVAPQGLSQSLRAEHYSVFLVVVRECPEHRYGPDCTAWCPDCLHGGECDATSGECLCPAGVTGHRCQTRCEDGFIGGSCSLPLGTTDPKRQVVCTGGLMRCTCAPGYHGNYCDEKCPLGSWGVDCKQTCPECEEECPNWYNHQGCEKCSLWGHCTKGTRATQCGQGELGLPRLRQPPSTSSVTLHSAVVSFSRWQPGYDDGELPRGTSMLYYLSLTSDTDRRTTTTQPTDDVTITLSDLKLNTTYHVTVLVAVMKNGQQCVADSDGRGRVHTFTTLPCPAPARLEGFSVAPSDTGLEAEWLDQNYEDGCDPKYVLFITPTHAGIKHSYLGDHKLKVTGLRGNTEYTMHLNICDQAGQRCNAISTTTRTLPGRPYIYNEEYRDGEVLIKWRSASGNDNNLKFRYKYKIVPQGHVPQSSSWSDWASTKTKRIAVFPFSKLNVSVQARNDEDEGQESTEVFTIPPSEPGPVKNLTLTPGSDSLKVEWEEPGDDPPKGTLQKFKVSWGESGKQSTNRGKVIWGRNNRQYTIRNLNPGTKYWVQVQAKNEGVHKYGAATKTTATTGMGIPGQVKNLEADGTQSSLTLTWQEPSSQSSVISGYSVLLYNASNVLQQNITVQDPQAKLEGLSDSQQYLAKVAACNDQHCGLDEELTSWTWPAKPSLQGTVNLVAANDTTITILLPLLSNPPGTHTVAVQREGREPPTQDWKDGLRGKAEVLVKGAMARHTRSPKQQEDGDTMYIAAQVEQEGDERVRVAVGGGTTAGRLGNPALQKDAAYWLVVVTEKQSGPAKYVERVVGTPRRFVASSSTFPAWIVGLLVGLALLAILAAAMVAVYRRQCRGKLTARRGNSLIVDTPESLRQPADAPLPMVPISDWQTHSCTEDIYGNTTLQVKGKDIEAYLMRAVMSRDTKIEFESVPAYLCNAYTESTRPENSSKNRYRNKAPYDDTRVILPLHNRVPHSDYINANYVQGPARTAAFIAAEGPMEGTVGAFWRMVWHVDCPTILMVANLKEGNKVKVAQYWPEQHPWTREGVKVTPTGVTVKLDFVIRTFTISVQGVNKKVCQYQYTAWPDHGVPTMPYGLAQMIKEASSEHVHHKPITVHCSAGIGRTGTVLLVMYLLDELQARGAITPVEALTTLRRGRGRLVENSEQYVFAHQVLLEVLVGMDSSYPCHSFQECLKTLQTQLSPDMSSPLHFQYQKLQSLPKDLSFKHGKDPACAYLNRHQDILPADSRLVMVPSKRSERDGPYLNVIMINALDQKDAYLAGEHPQLSTLDKMWRLVYERRVAVWVLLHSFPDGDPEFPEVTSVSVETMGNMTLKVGPTQAFQNFYERQVDIYVKSLGQVTKHKCLLLSLRGWPAADCLPATPEPLLAVIERMEALCSLDQPPLFTCKDGVTACGVMAALLVAVSRTKLIQQVDIYRSVASVQQDRPQFVVNLEQYVFLHHAMAAFLSSNNLYGNFN